jgi:thymidylate kinase
VGEDQTLMPILHNNEKSAALKLLDEVVKKVLASDNEVVIFDRLYFTHIFRTNSNVDDFSEIINLLSKYEVLLVLLTIEKSSIGDRILKTMEQRGPGWTEFVKKKGTNEEIVEYYTDQQDKLINLAKESELPTVVFDTTLGNYEEINYAVVKKLNL